MSISAKLFVGQIPSTCGENEVEQLFRPFGPIQEVFIIRDKSTKKHKGSAFVTFRDSHAAQLAIQTLHDLHTIPPHTKPLQVRFADSQVSPATSIQSFTQSTVPRPFTTFGLPSLLPSASKKVQPSRGGRKVFVGQLPRTMTENELLSLMSPYGEVEECVILRDKITREGKGAAFVVFSGAAEANRAIKALHNQVVLPPLNKPLQVKFAEGECAPPAGDPKLFVGMINRAATEQDIHDVFSPFGQIVDIYIIKKNGQCQGACFVKYETLEACDAAISALDGKVTMPGASQALNVRYAADSSNKRKEGLLHAFQTPSMAAPLAEPLLAPLLTPQTALAAALSQLQPNGAGQLGPLELAFQLQQLQQIQQLQQLQHLQQLQQLYAQTPQAQPLKQATGPEGANLFVTHLPSNYTDDYLRQMFEPFGPLVSAKVFCDKQTGQSKGFGFVSFSSPANAQTAIAAMNGFQIGGQRLSVQLKADRHKPY